MTKYNLGKVVGEDGVSVTDVSAIILNNGNTRVTVTLSNGTSRTFDVNRGIKGEDGEKGDTGKGIQSISLYSTEGKTKTYAVTYTDSTVFYFNVIDGDDASITIDTELDSTSTNAVENRVVTNAVNTINTTLNTKLTHRDVLQILIDYGLVRTVDTANSVVLAGDKSILSYSDGDILTLSATVYDENNAVVPNKRVVFYKDDTVLDTVYTDANGVATYEYHSAGVGDVSFEASVGSLLSETYSIKDTLKYISDTLTSTQILTVPNIPTNFKCKFKVKCDNIIYDPENTGWLEIGSDTNNLLIFGNTGSRGHIGIFVKVGGSYVVNQYKSSLSAQTWTELTYTYEDGLQTITDGTETVTVNNSQITARNYIRFLNASTNKNPIKELMIMPL